MNRRLGASLATIPRDTALAGEIAAEPPAWRRSRSLRVVYYSRFVSLMRVLLPGIAVALLGVVVVWPQLGQERLGIGFGGGEFGANSLDMINPRYYGTDARNRPFAVTAESARPADTRDTAVSLQAPKADMTLTDGSGILVGAERGVYSRLDQVVDLSGGVDVFSDKGYELHTPSARIDLRQGTAKGSEGITGHGPFGEIEAEGFSLVDRGRNIHFTGKARLVLHPSRMQTQ